jgi:uncharacterized protein YdeI (YjbR/CyaY-like superfamily)
MEMDRSEMVSHMRTIFVKDRTEWRAWLTTNHDKENEVWLVYHKKGTGKESIPYNASVEEALCFGWVDSLIKKLDETCYARKFTPRKPGSKWSASNIKRVEAMIAKGYMTKYGLRLVEAAKSNGHWGNPVQRPQLEFKLPAEFTKALAQNPKARETFEKLALSHQKQYIGWIEVAKRPDTKARRIAESIQLLERGEKLGLK